MSRGRRIGRLKFLPPPPKIAEKYLYDWENGELYRNPEKFPHLSRQGLFGIEGNMRLEIGCGTGEMICHLAEALPEHSFVGVDLSRRAIYYAVDLADKLNLINIRFIKADIKLLYPLMVKESWEMVYLHFPDPNYGDKYIKHRVFDKIFLDQMNVCLAPQGKINVATDQKPLLMDMLELTEGDNRYRKTHDGPTLTSPNISVQSRFHQAWVRNQREIYQFELVKTE